MPPPPSATTIHGVFATAVPRYVITGDRMREPLRNVMRPGVVVIAEDASVAQAQRALLAHHVHAVLVIERTGRPLGWATTTGLLGFVERDVVSLSAREAVSEHASTLEPWRPVRDALQAMRHEGVSRILVASSAGRLPEGVVSELDLLALLTR
jgi:predicted transcriptional regulator